MTGQRYRTIVADPPWPFEWRGGMGGRRRNQTELGYETMEPAEIGNVLGLERGLWAEDATLFLWVTQHVLHWGIARSIAKRWGFDQRVGELIWRKPNFGTGACPRIGHETCVIYRRGAGSLKPDAPRDIHSVQAWKQVYATNSGKTHSAKPDGFYDLVAQCWEGPYAELFARRARFGWHYPIGDQTLGGAAA